MVTMGNMQECYAFTPAPPWTVYRHISIGKYHADLTRACKLRNAGLARRRSRAISVYLYLRSMSDDYMGRSRENGKTRRDGTDGGGIVTPASLPAAITTFFSLRPIVRPIQQTACGPHRTAIAGLLLRFQPRSNSLWLDEHRRSCSPGSRSPASGRAPREASSTRRSHWLEHGMLLLGRASSCSTSSALLACCDTGRLLRRKGVQRPERRAHRRRPPCVLAFPIYYSQEARAYAPMLFFFSRAPLREGRAVGRVRS